MKLHRYEISPYNPSTLVLHGEAKLLNVAYAPECTGPMSVFVAEPDYASPGNSTAVDFVILFADADIPEGFEFLDAAVTEFGGCRLVFYRKS